MEHTPSNKRLHVSGVHGSSVVFGDTVPCCSATCQSCSGSRLGFAFSFTLFSPWEIACDMCGVVVLCAVNF